VSTRRQPDYIYGNSENGLRQSKSSEAGGARGERIVISRYNIPMAELVPPTDVPKPLSKFGTGKGRATVIDPHAFDAMTNDEADSRRNLLTCASPSGYSGTSGL
jgi:antitoxin (DNA-binding transcriptional repressor) of toxin-antitoxin stability system